MKQFDKNGNANVDNNEMSVQKWFKSIYGWSSLETYAFSILKSSSRTISESRKKYIERQELDSIND